MRYIACSNDRHLHPRPNSPSLLAEAYGHTPDMRTFKPRAILGPYGARGKSLHSSSQDERRSFVGTMDTPRPASGSSKATTPYFSSTSFQVNTPAGGAPKASAPGNSEAKRLVE